MRRGAPTRSSTCVSFRSAPFASATVTAVCAFARLGIPFLFMMSLYLQGERGYSAMHTGLIYLPIAIGALVFSPLSGRLVGRFGSRPSLLVVIDDHRRRRHADLPDADDACLGDAVDLRHVRNRIRHDQCPVTNAAVSGCHATAPGAASAVTSTSRAGRCEYRCGAVRFGRRFGVGGEP